MKYTITRLLRIKVHGHTTRAPPAGIKSTSHHIAGKQTTKIIAAERDAIRSRKLSGGELSCTGTTNRKGIPLLLKFCCGLQHNFPEYHQNSFWIVF